MFPPKTILNRIEAKTQAREMQRLAKASGRRLSYTQALAEVAKSAGYANVHQMTASFRVDADPLAALEIVRQERAGALARIRELLVAASETHRSQPGISFHRKLHPDLLDDAKIPGSAFYRDAIDGILNLIKHTAHNDHDYVLGAALNMLDEAARKSDLTAALTAVRRAMSEAEVVFGDTVLSIAGDGAHTLINYLYCDASNWKTAGIALLRGRLSPRAITLLLAKLDEGAFFIPGQIGLADLQDSFAEPSHWDPERDHPWHRLHGIAYVDLPSASSAEALSASDIAAAIETVAWDGSYEPPFAAKMHARYQEYLRRNADE